MSDWVILLPAFVMMALMIATHTYLGLHVLARGIIFVDLALAQIAALGVSIAFLFGQESHGLASQAYAFGATLIAAFGFAKLRELPNKTAREVTIGCVYVVATALSIVILSRSSQGMEELKAMFNGNILWVQWQEITVVAIAYLVLSVLHFIYYRQFKALSFKPDEAEENQVNRPSFLWEFLFFATFALTITLAVNVAGVLLVFAFLIIPAFSASIIIESFLNRLLVGWSMGILGSAIGLWLSLWADLPVGATVVSVLGMVPIIAILIRVFKRGG